MTTEDPDTPAPDHADTPPIEPGDTAAPLRDTAQPSHAESALPDDAQPSDVAQPFHVESASPEDAPAPQPDAPPQREPRRLSRAERETLDRQQRRFAACGRCGYFVADCRIYLGDETFQTAALDASDGWLRLEGDATFHRLLQNAYGIPPDAEFDSFDGLCPECRRRFVLINRPDGRARLKIQI